MTARSTYGLDVTVERVTRGPMAGAIDVSAIQWRRGSADIIAEYPAQRFLYYGKREAIALYRAAIRDGKLTPDGFRWQA
jgi:hypothetical protein